MRSCSMSFVEVKNYLRFFLIVFLIPVVALWSKSVRPRGC